MSIKIIPVDFGDYGLGYDVQVNDDSVSIQNYLDALNTALLEMDLSRSPENGVVCKGCDCCCGERIPVTMVDLVTLSENPRVLEQLSARSILPEERLWDVLRRFCHIYVNGRSVDVTLRLTPEQKCVFLDQATKTCSIYDHRPFVCQTFICCPATREALDLREAVVNSGEDELVRKWLEQAQESCEGIWYDEGDAPNIHREDWKPGPFSGKNRYGDILLKDVLPAGLWERLRTAV